jgi:hypothetical protein
MGVMDEPLYIKKKNIPYSLTFYREDKEGTYVFIKPMLPFYLTNVIMD